MTGSGGSFLLIVGLTLLWTAAQSDWLDRRLSRLIERMLRKWTDLDVRDYASVLHLSGEYRVSELVVRSKDWMAQRSLGELRLAEEGVIVLGIKTPDGRYLGVPKSTTRLQPGDELLVYGREKSIQALDRRRTGIGGQLSHLEAVAEQKKVDEEQEAEEKRAREEKPPDSIDDE